MPKMPRPLSYRVGDVATRTTLPELLGAHESEGSERCGSYTYSRGESRVVEEIDLVDLHDKQES
jgi:hypothetical protein